MPTTTPTPSPPPIAGNVECAGCGYNLRTMEFAGKCPECGLAVRRSVVGLGLKALPTWWLMRVALGLGLLVLTNIAVAVIMLFVNFGPGVPWAVSASARRTLLSMRR